jgi:regulator of protease activity HflC (stomatin/prohibitin superfamily)
MTWVVLSVLLLVAAAIAVVVMRIGKSKMNNFEAANAAWEADTAAASSGQALGYRSRPVDGGGGAVMWKSGKYALIAVAAIFVLLTVVSSCAVGSSKNVGVETAFGKTDGFLSNGAHLIPPWDKVTEMDAAVQTDSYTLKPGSHENAHGDKECLNVRIGNQQTACVAVSIRWRIDPKKADDLFQNYRSFEHVRDSLVTRELTAAVNQQFKDYNPLNSVAVSTPGVKRNPALSVYANRITAQMKREIGGEGIEVLNTIIPIAFFDTATQARINQLQQQFALTRIAQQEHETNVAQAEANRALASSVNTSPNVLVAQCLTILGEMVKQGQTVPAGFSCWPGGSKIGIIAGTGK